MFDAQKKKMQRWINIYHLFRAYFSVLSKGYPSKKLKVIGVTGTDGKTTTTHCIYHVLKSAGKKVSMISTVYAKVGDQEFETGLHVTTPDASLVQKLLKKAVQNGDEYFVLETTSHGLDQNRNYGVSYQVGVITNVTHEHLDYHKTYENYLRTKLKLIKQSKLGIINRDDASFEQIEELKKTDKALASKTIKTYGIVNDADYHEDLKKVLKQQIPEYNNYNYLAAYAVANELGLSRQEILKALKTYTLPKGRYEVVYDDKFLVIIDFAHTPNSLKNILSELRVKADRRRGKLIHVFGSAGLRDVQKRPSMGEASEQYAHVSIITEEDFRTENPEQIANEIKSGMKDPVRREMQKKLFYIENRQKAVTKAIEMAKRGDIIVCTGKAHEKSLNRNGKEEPWDEFEAVTTALNLRKPEQV